jgi:hypothetical protein
MPVLDHIHLFKSRSSQKGVLQLSAYVRSRTKGAISPRIYKETVSYFNQPDVLSGDIYANGVGNKAAMIDVVSSNFKRDQEDGVIVNNRLSSSKEFCYASEATRTLILKTPPAYVTGVAWKYTRPHSGNGLGDRARYIGVDRGMDSLITEACTSALANIDKPTAQGLVFLSQLSQTIQSLKAPLAGIAQTIHGIKQLSKASSINTVTSSTRKINGKVLPALNVSRARQLKNAKYAKSAKRRQGSRNAIKGIANQQLLIVFGILPAIKDIEDILKALQSQRPPRQTARGMATATGSITWSRPYNDGQVSSTISGTGSRTVIVKAGCLYEHEFDLGVSKFGLSISQIPSAAWELVSYSFVVDWFVNVGKYIAAITPTIGTKRLAEWYTIRDITTRHEVLGSLTAVSSLYSATGGGDSYTSVTETRLREPCNLGEHLGLTLNPNRLNVGQITSAISLIVQKLKF